MIYRTLKSEMLMVSLDMYMDRCKYLTNLKPFAFTEATAYGNDDENAVGPRNILYCFSYYELKFYVYRSVLLN